MIGVGYGVGQLLCEVKREEEQSGCGGRAREWGSCR